MKLLVSLWAEREVGATICCDFLRAHCVSILRMEDAVLLVKRASLAPGFMTRIVVVARTAITLTLTKLTCTHEIINRMQNPYE